MTEIKDLLRNIKIDLDSLANNESQPNWPYWAKVTIKKITLALLKTNYLPMNKIKKLLESKAKMHLLNCLVTDKRFDNQDEIRNVALCIDKALALVEAESQPDKPCDRCGVVRGNHNELVVRCKICDSVDKTLLLLLKQSADKPCTMCQKNFTTYKECPCFKCNLHTKDNPDIECGCENGTGFYSLEQQKAECSECPKQSFCDIFQNVEQYLNACPRCGGTGKEPGKPCKTCEVYKQYCQYECGEFRTGKEPAFKTSEAWTCSEERKQLMASCEDQSKSLDQLQTKITELKDSQARIQKLEEKNKHFRLIEGDLMAQVKSKNEMGKVWIRKVKELEEKRREDAGLFCREHNKYIDTKELLTKENIRANELAFVAKEFGVWYSRDGCPWAQNQFCPDYDKIKKEFDEENKDDPPDETYPFDPTEECGVDMQGECFVEYYKKLYNDSLPEAK